MFMVAAGLLSWRHREYHASSHFPLEYKYSGSSYRAGIREQESQIFTVRANTCKGGDMV